MDLTVRYSDCRENINRKTKNPHFDPISKPKLNKIGVSRYRHHTLNKQHTTWMGEQLKAACSHKDKTIHHVSVRILTKPN